MWNSTTSDAMSIIHRLLQNWEWQLHSTILRMRNHWDIWLSLNCRDWTNSDKLSSKVVKFWPPASFILGWMVVCVSQPWPLRVVLSLPRCREIYSPKIILQAEWQSTTKVSQWFKLSSFCNKADNSESRWFDSIQNTKKCNMFLIAQYNNYFKAFVSFCKTIISGACRKFIVLCEGK